MNRAQRYELVLAHFQEHHPGAATELHYTDPFSLLVAVILSAQCTDKRVNLVTPALLEKYPTAPRMAKAAPEELLNYISSISYPNNKSKHLVAMAQKLVNQFGGMVPSKIDELVQLPGVGRKTANVIASVIFNKPAMAVDTHVFRVSNRLGLTQDARNPLQCEKQLTKFIPEHLVPRAHHWLILHGRYVCKARTPACDACGLSKFCRYFEKNIRTKNHFSNNKINKQTTYGKEDTKKDSA